MVDVVIDTSSTLAGRTVQLFIDALFVPLEHRRVDSDVRSGCHVAGRAAPTIRVTRSRMSEPGTRNPGRILEGARRDKSTRDAEVSADFAIGIPAGI
jgi:hypothetical protein